MSSFQTYKVVGNRTTLTNNFSIGSPISNSGSYHTEVNTMLAGSMMISLSFLVVGLCFFLHRKLKKEPGPVSLHTLPWTDENLEIFTLSGQEEVTGIYLPQPAPSPPPSYELVVKIRDKEEELSPRKPSPEEMKEEKITIEDEGLPSYEAAIKLGAQEITKEGVRILRVIPSGLFISSGDNDRLFSSKWVDIQSSHKDRLRIRRLETDTPGRLSSDSESKKKYNAKKFFPTVHQK